MKRLFDITLQMTNPTDYEIRQEIKAYTIRSKEVEELEEQRKELAHEILHQQPNKSVHDVAIISSLPVLVVRELKNKEER